MRQAIEGRKGRALLPFEILELVDQELAQPEFRVECTAAYLATIRGFALDFIARRVGRFRKSHGMFEAEEREPEWDEYTDLTMGATGMEYFDAVSALYSKFFEGRRPESNRG